MPESTDMDRDCQSSAFECEDASKTEATAAAARERSAPRLGERLAKLVRHELQTNVGFRQYSYAVRISCPRSITDGVTEVGDLVPAVVRPSAVLAASGPTSRRRRRAR